jgi:hypothetical protein
MRQKARDISAEAEAWNPSYPNLQKNPPGQRHVAIVLGFTPTKKPLNATVSVLQSNHRKQTNRSKQNGKRKNHLDSWQQQHIHDPRT